MFRNVSPLLALSLAFVLSINAFAQSAEPETGKKITVGLKAGGNLYDTYQAGNKYYVSTPHAGFHAGVYGDYQFSLLRQDLAVRAEALFSTRGLYLSEYINGTRVNYEREASYVDFPVSVNYQLWKKLSIHAGVVPSLFVEEYRAVTKDAEGFKIAEGDQFRSYERWQFGALAGVSYPFELMGQNFEGGVRYNMAFTRTSELIRDVRASRDPKYMMLQLYLTYKVFEF